MSYLVIPKEVTSRTANVWVAAINEEIDPATAFLRFGDQELPLGSNWIEYRTESGRNFMCYQHINLWDLPPGTGFALALVAGHEVRANGHFRTRCRQIFRRSTIDRSMFCWRRVSPPSVPTAYISAVLT